MLLGGEIMVIGIGTDIVKTVRFEGMTEPFMARVYTPNERAYFLQKGHVTAAGIFAAKEAVAKALGTGFSFFWPNMIEISYDSSGKPSVILYDSAALAAKKLTKRKRRFNRGYVISLSISHTDEDAIAVALISTR